MAKFLNISNADDFEAGIRKFTEDWVADGTQIGKVLKGLAIDSFKYLLERTPEYSGNAVSNWNMSVGEEDAFVAVMGVPAISKKKGDTPYSVLRPNYSAWEIAKERASGKLSSVDNMYKKIFISNSSESLNGSGYIMNLENNPNNFLRADNNGGHMVNKVMVIMSVKYEHMSDSTVTELISTANTFG